MILFAEYVERQAGWLTAAHSVALLLKSCYIKEPPAGRVSCSLSHSLLMLVSGRVGQRECL
jgi:hypothetical protein